MKYFYSFIFFITTVVISANVKVNAVNGFIENKGQIVDMNGNLVPDVFFKIQTNNIDCYVTKTGITYLFKKIITDSISNDEKTLFKWERVNVVLKNAVIDSNNIVRENVSNQGVLNYFLGHNSNGIRNVKEYGKITIKNVYPNIDWVLYNSTENGFKYDFVLHKGAVVADVKLEYQSRNEAKLLESGEIKIDTEFGALIEKAPISYYDGKKIESYFLLESKKIEKSKSFTNNVSFEFNSIVSSVIGDKELVIDPILEWASFYGGSVLGERVRSVETDNEGNAVYVGSTSSSDFPTLDGGGYYQNTGGYQGIGFSELDCFVVKFDKNGVRLWATYYGSVAVDIAHDVAIDKNNNIFFVGKTQSENFPTFDAGTYYLPYTNYWDRMEDCFIVKLSSESDLLWATCFGGTSNDRAYAITIDINEDIYVGGRTDSGDFLYKEQASSYNQATTSAVHNQDGFLTKFSNNGNYLWGTPLGGSYSNYVTDLDTDSQGNLFVLGTTRSNDFPVMDNGTYFQANIGGNYSDYWTNKRDLTIMKFTQAGELKWSTYYGGTEMEGFSFGSLVVDLNDDIYILSFGSLDNNALLLDAGGFFETGGLNNTILLKFDNKGERLWASFFNQGSLPNPNNYSTGESTNSANKLSIDKCTNHLYALLQTFNSSRSTVPINNNSYQQAYGGELDHFLVEFDENTNLVYSSYLGGSGQDAYGCITTDFSGGIWVGQNIECKLSAFHLQYSIANSYPIPQSNGYYQDITPSSSNQSEFFLSKFTRENTINCGDNPVDNPVDNSISNLYIPNVFTPNGDDDNDVFAITINGELITENGALTIFNRWGNKVLSTNKEMKWDGLANPSGVYYYIFKYNDSVFKGNISLFKTK